MKRLIAICLCFILLSSPLFWGKLKNQAYADPFTAAQIGAAAYAAMASWGIGFTSGNATAAGMSDFMANQVDSYVGSTGGSIASVFGSQLAIDIAGKLVVGHQMYNALISFKDWLVSKFGIDEEDSKLQDGVYNGLAIPNNGTAGEISQQGLSATFNAYAVGNRGEGYKGITIYLNGSRLTGNYSGGSMVYTGAGVSLVYKDNNLYFQSPTTDLNIGGHGTWEMLYIRNPSLTNSLSWNGLDYVAPTVIDPSYEWLGQVGDYQDTNLEQLLGHIYEDVEGNNLVVDGEVVPLDPPGPTPTPSPIDPDTPLQDVPWDGLDTNLQNLYNQGLEEIGAIGDAQDAIIDSIGVQTGALEGAISGNAGVVSGAIGQAVSDIQDAISEQTESLSESASATAEATESIAEALEDETIDWQKFDLRGLFPFCIPFDIYNMLEALDASPTAPHVQLPFVIESIGFSYTIDLDFSAFDQVAAVMRQMELIVYGLALAWATSKVIKW